MADTDLPDRSRSQDPVTPTTEPSDFVLDLRDTEPLVDLRDAPSVRLTGPPSTDDATAATERPVTDLAGLERRDAMQRARYIAVLVITVLNAFDIITTYVAISLGAHEGNPIVAWMISSRLVIVAKVLICGSLIFGAVFATHHRVRVTLAGLCAAWAVVGVYSLTVLLNTVSVFTHL